MSNKISKDLPLSEITLRRYEKPLDLNSRETVRRLCLSLGLLQVGDSRDVIVDILLVLIESKNNKKMLTSEQITNEVVKLRRKNKMDILGTTSPNIRRQLKRLKDILIIEKILNAYRLNEYQSFEEIYKNKIQKYLIDQINDRLLDYLKAVDNIKNEKI